MKRIIILVIAVISVAGLFGYVRNSENSNDSLVAFSDESMSSISEDLASGGQLIDVRTPAEYAGGHIKGANNVPLQSIQAGALPTAAKNKPVYVYCQSGNRSKQAAAALKAAGYQNVIDLGAMSHVQTLGGTVNS